MSKADLAAVKEWEKEKNVIVRAEEEFDPDAQHPTLEVVSPPQVRPPDRAQDSAPPHRTSPLCSCLPSFDETAAGWAGSVGNPLGARYRVRRTPPTPTRPCHLVHLQQWCWGQDRRYCFCSVMTTSAAAEVHTACLCGCNCIHRIALLTLHHAAGNHGQPSSQVSAAGAVADAFQATCIDMLWAWLLTVPTVLPHSATAKPHSALCFVNAIASTVHKNFKPSSHAAFIECFNLHCLVQVGNSSHTPAHGIMLGLLKLSVLFCCLSAFCQRSRGKFKVEIDPCLVCHAQEDSELDEQSGELPACLPACLLAVMAHY